MFIIMAGGFTCPHCDTFNKCNCKSCKETYLSKGMTDNFVSWDGAGELCICSGCNKKFHEGQSLDIEWEGMIENDSQILTKDICYEWMFYCIKKLETKSKEWRDKEYDMYKKYSYNEYSFNRTFTHHFKVSPYTIRDRGISGLRDLQINKILD